MALCSLVNCGPAAAELLREGVALSAEKHTLAHTEGRIVLDDVHGSALATGSHSVIRYQLPVADSVPGIIDCAEGGSIWFVMGGGGFAGLPQKSLSYVGCMDGEGAITVFELPTPQALPNGICVAADGRVYVTEYGGNKIAVIDPKTRLVSEFVIPSAASNPTALDLDSHNRIWFNLNKAHKLACLNQNGKIAEYAIPTPQSRPTGLVVDDRDNVWFAEMYGNKIGMLSPQGDIVEYALSEPQSKPTAMCFDKHSGVWFCQRGSSKLGNIRDGQLREIPLPGNYSGPFFITRGPDNAIWFTELYNGKIGRLDLATESLSEIDLKCGDDWPGALAFDERGNLWITLMKGNSIIKIDAKPLSS